MRLIKVSKVTALDGYKLDLAFTDGTRGVADLSADLEGPLAALRLPGLWSQARVERGTIAWNDDLDLAPEFLYARAHGLEAPKTGEDVAANQMSVTMRELRAFAGKSQVEVAEAMGVAQAEVSRLEGRADTKLSTIERYVRALGGGGRGGRAVRRPLAPPEHWINAGRSGLLGGMGLSATVLRRGLERAAKVDL